MYDDDIHCVHTSVFVGQYLCKFLMNCYGPQFLLNHQIQFLTFLKIMTFILGTLLSSLPPLLSPKTQHDYKLDLIICFLFNSIDLPLFPPITFYFSQKMIIGKKIFGFSAHFWLYVGAALETKLKI